MVWCFLRGNIVSQEGSIMGRQVRLTEPLVRDNGRLRPASWDEALDRAAAGFAVARERDATRSFGMFSCSKATNEMNYAAQKFTRAVMGSNNIDSCNRT
jgi:formate dehydrogenase (hydrogenase)